MIHKHYIYQEDDWVAEVEIVEDRSTPVLEDYTLRVVRSYQSQVYGPVEDGTQFDCSQRYGVRIFRLIPI